MTTKHTTHAQSGFSLVELMIALLLGTLVIAAAGGIFIANRQTFRSTENLGYVQEGMRTAFELMARDLREASGNPCSRSAPLANVINAPASRWWTGMTDWGLGIRGYGANNAFADSAFGTASAQRLAGTEAIELFASQSPVHTVASHDASGATFTMVEANHGFEHGDLLLVCSPRHAGLFQASAVTGNTISHAVGGTPGNCTASLNVPANCSGGMRYQFNSAGVDTVIARLHAARWYVANNPAGRPSLYQQRIVTVTQQAQVLSQEVVEGVRDLEFMYLIAGQNAYVNAAAVGGAWNEVVSVRILAEVEDAQEAQGAAQGMVRTVEHVVSLRNRNL